MQLHDADRLLDPSAMSLETGIERLPDGVLHVACRTDLHGCTGEMFEWWFRFRPDTQRYIWRHPVDHVFSDWLECREGTHVGSIHRVEEFFTGQPLEKLLIQCQDAEQFFNAGAYRVARERGHVSAAVCGRVGFGWCAPRLPDGRILGGRLLHIGRDRLGMRASQSLLHRPGPSRHGKEPRTGGGNGSGCVRRGIADALLQRVHVSRTLPAIPVHRGKQQDASCRASMVIPTNV